MSSAFVAGLPWGYEGIACKDPLLRCIGGFSPEEMLQADAVGKFGGFDRTGAASES